MNQLTILFIISIVFLLAGAAALRTSHIYSGITSVTIGLSLLALWIIIKALLKI